MKRKIVTWRTVLWAILILLVGGGAAGYAWVTHDLPSLDVLPAQLNTPSVRITDRQVRLLYEMLPANVVRHTVRLLNQIPLH